MPRLFTGLEIPAPQRSILARLQTGLGNVRWVEPSDLHVTLRFIGDVSGAMAREIVEALARRNWSSCVIHLEGLAHFGSGKPTSIHATVKPDDDLMLLQAGQEQLMQRLGLPADGRKFVPHVTLARGRGLKPEPVAKYLSTQGFFLAQPFVAERFVLYSARDSVGGGPYVIEEVFPLARPAGVLKTAAGIDGVMGFKE